LADFSGQFGGKIRPLKKKIRLLVIFPVGRHFALRNKTIFVHVSRISIIVLDLPKLERRRVGKQTFMKFDLFSALSVQNQTKFCRKFVPSLCFENSAPFELCGRIFGKLATLVKRAENKDLNSGSQSCMETPPPHPQG
jgi:hypothetical protein